MAEIKIPILIELRAGGQRAVTAWGRSEDAALVCHPISEHEDGDWTITHRKTGRRVNPSVTRDKTAALALIDAYAPLADWSAVADDTDALHNLREIIEHIYERFETATPIES